MSGNLNRYNFWNNDGVILLPSYVEIPLVFQNATKND